MSFSLAWGKGEKQLTEYVRSVLVSLRMNASHGSRISIHKMSRRSTTNGN